MALPTIENQQPQSIRYVLTRGIFIIPTPLPQPVSKASSCSVDCINTQWRLERAMGVMLGGGAKMHWGDRLRLRSVLESQTAFEECIRYCHSGVSAYYI